MSEENNGICGQSCMRWGLVVLLVVMVVASVMIWRGMNDSGNKTDTVSESTNGSVPASEEAVRAVLPEEVPVPAVQEVLSPSQEFGLAEQTTTFVSPKGPDELLEFYMAEIVAKGGTIESSMTTPENQILAARLADGRTYVVYIKGLSEGGSEVTINVEPVQ